MSLFEVLVLAVVQGLTEFLPVSSDGHLVLANALLTAAGASPTRDLLEVSIVLHQGTLAAVLLHYRREVLRLLGADRRVIGLLILGTLPAAVVGIALKKGLSDSTAAMVLENLLIAGLGFLVTAATLVVAITRSEGNDDYTRLTWRGALAIGLAQSTALLPGVSRSGSTISSGLAVGLTRESATTFAFLLAIPAILGAGLLEGIEVYQQGGAATRADYLAAGFVVSFLVGLGALKLVIRFVQRGRLAAFVWYLVPLGVATIAARLAGWL